MEKDLSLDEELLLMEISNSERRLCSIGHQTEDIIIEGLYISPRHSQGCFKKIKRILD